MFFFSENYFSKLPRQVQAHLTRGNLRVFSSEFAQLAQLHVAVICDFSQIQRDTGAR